jgi:TatA/E family protein of Tat protein translocase
MLIALAVLLVFGPRKLPELARGVGESLKELKQSLHGAATSEEAALVHEIGQTVSEIRVAANPLVAPAGSFESGTPPRA